MSNAALPHICIDGTCIVPHGKGASVYALSLLRALQELNPPARFTILMRQEAVDSLNISHSNWSIQGINLNSAHLWHLFALSRLLQKLQPDIIHFLGESALLWLPIPYIMTIHELPHLYRKWVGNASSSLYYYLSQKIIEILLPNACRQAAHLLAVSQNTASDLAREFNIDSQNITVTYEAAPPHFLVAKTQPISDWCRLIPRPYLLTFATGDRREVPEQVVEALGIIISQIPHHLVIAGRCPDWQKSILTDIAVKLGCLKKLHFTGFVSDEDLPLLYRDADVYIEISRYEGFGLQVCEAMATGTVAIASNVASLPEVIGNAGYLIPLGDSATLADKLLLLLTKQIEVQRLAKLAQQQAAQFSWDKCAMKTWNVIEQVIKNNR